MTPPDLVETIPDGDIPSGSEAGNLLGFTDEKFSGTLVKKGKRIIIQMIESREKRKNNTRTFFLHLLSLGFTLDVTRPIDDMSKLCRSLGFIPTWEWSDVHTCYVWLWRGKR